MDSEVSETIPPRQLRRSTRRQSVSASARAVNYEPTPRGPLKRAKKPSKPQSEASAVNGTDDNGSEDEGSPNKKKCLEAGDKVAGGDGHVPRKDESEPMETEDNSEVHEVAIGPNKSLQKQPKNSPSLGSLEQVPSKSFVALGQRCSVPESESRIKTKVEQPNNPKHTTSTTLSKRKPDHVTVTSMDDYRRKLEAKIREMPKENHNDPKNYPIPQTNIRRRPTDSSMPKVDVAVKRQEIKKTGVSGQTVQVSSEGVFKKKPRRGFWQLVLLLLLIAGLLLAFKHLPTPQRTKDDSAQPSTAVNLGLFVEELSRVALRFPSQRPELWKRSQIHLRKHLDQPHPTEPVSMILTAGVRAQKTMFCLARNIASSFSSALNASFVVIDGDSLSTLDSDQVKMDIDSQLKVAFGGDKLAAVVHRFEELPPGSTLIFYRYCDHETAAYKRAFILFTVLLSEEDISTQKSLKEVEEMVRDHVEEKFVSSETAFNKMDADKFSGLWSRIAHLILPVAYEAEVEQRGC